MPRFLVTALAAAALTLAGCASAPHTGPTAVFTPSGMPASAASPSIPGLPSASIPPSTPAAGPITAHDPGQVTSMGGPYMTACHTRDHGLLPDRTCTPGAYDPAITAAILCAPGYTTSSYRPPSSETTVVKYTVVEPGYGEHNVTGELDHLIPLELGGANDLANLWVEPGRIPNSKDSVENTLHAWVCWGGADAQSRLHRAQLAIAADWLTAEQVLGA